MSMKKAYEHELKARLLEYEAEIERFKAKAENAGDDVRQRYQVEIADLEERRRRLLAKFDEMREAGEGAWEDMKVGIDAAWEDLSRAMKSAASRF